MRSIIGGAVLCVLGSGPIAFALDTSIRPEARQAPAAKQIILTAPQLLSSSPRPPERPIRQIVLNTDEGPVTDAQFQTWISAFKTRAQAQGIDKAVLDQSLNGVRYNPEVIRLDRNQSEFTKTIWDYLKTAASDARIANGKKAMARHQTTLDAIEAKYGVDKEVVVAIWGMESAYGGFRGRSSVMRSLATLAFDGRRSAFFEKQLIAALRIIQSGDTSPANMKGSWAGAMGHTQFMPTSYLAHAVDFTGDGRRDIWSDDPTDALASTAAYLKHFGWTKGQPWGVEVQIPEGFNFTLAKRGLTKNPSAWARLGVVDMNGRAVPNHGPASILLPAGGKGAAFMVFKNFSVIERYNPADAYVIGVGHLSDRITGGPKIQTPWPLDDRALTRKERKELQVRLTQKGFDTAGVDGKIGPRTQDALRSYQLAQGLLPDGHASFKMLEHLR